MTKEAINELKKYTLGRKNTEKVEISVLQLNRVIKALEQEPCDDAISREIALKECHDIVVDGERYRVIQEETLLGLPSVNPQEPCSNCCNGNQIEKAKLCQKSYLAGMEHKQEPKWIPISERLPKAGEYIGDVAKYYLVQNEHGDMLVARYTHGEYWEQIYQLKPISDEIVAWMPLPKSYEPQESEE